MKKTEILIEKCLKEAIKAQGKVSPNPLVGAVILDENGKFVSSGYHKCYGQAHAEVNAIKKAGEKAKNGTLAVNLEPCSHWGKTPPCVDLIIKSGLKKVIIGMSDPNPMVNGKGIKKLQEANIEVIVGVCQKQCEKLNEIFIINQLKKKPFVAIKTATTLDGKIATANGNSKWITCEDSRKFVHKLRKSYDAILTSSSTVLADNPQMTCRIKNGRNPVRVIVDTKLRTSPNLKIYNCDKTKIFLAVSDSLRILPEIPDHINLIKCPLKNSLIDLNFLTQYLYNEGIMSIMIEAGGTLNSAFISEGLVDKLYHFCAPKILGDDKAKSFVTGFSPASISQSINLRLESVEKIGSDTLTQYYFD